jgi:hypothetical protein
MLTSDHRLAAQAARLCELFATPDELASDLDAVMETMVVCVLHLCHQNGGDPYEFMRDATQAYYETMVVNADDN